MKATVTLFLSAVLSFSGLAVLDRRARMAAIEGPPRGISGDTFLPLHPDSNTTLIGMSSADVRERLGRPVRIAKNDYGITVWTYRDRVVEFNHVGEVADVVVFTPSSD